MPSGDRGTTVPARHSPLKRRTAGIAILVAAALLTLAAPAGASKLQYGIVPQDGALPSTTDLDMMPGGGIDSLRLDDPVGRGRDDPGHVRLVVGRRDRSAS